MLNEQKLKEDKGFFERWLPLIFWRPIACISVFVTASLAYGAAGAAFALLGGTHFILPLLCGAFALVAAYSYFMEKGSKIYEGLSILGHYLDHPNSIKNFLKEYQATLIMLGVAIALGILFVYLPPSIGYIIGPGGLFAAKLGLAAVNDFVYAGVIAFLALVLQSMLVPLCAGLYCPVKTAVLNFFGYESVTCPVLPEDLAMKKKMTTNQQQDKGKHVTLPKVIFAPGNRNASQLFNHGYRSLSNPDLASSTATTAKLKFFMPVADNKIVDNKKEGIFAQKQKIEKSPKLGVSFR